ncbi:hypothetical protein C8R44DRAFT_797132 [Mycena epipterygia]|nr:hypothetical protein C8R44DRAFT_797132 [Mycena epipterygia]
MSEGDTSPLRPTVAARILMDDQPNIGPFSDNDRLITVLRACFADLIQKQEEQTERLHKAVEALQPPATVTDKKTTFWNSYMKLADEHDKEFQQKYSSDLDTALIFAGLFSAVGSAFIIQIQPQLMPPNLPSTIIVVVQSLLYISLFTTLLAALLAVLGKQWVMHYGAAGSRGAIEERGLERQRKLDGLRRWKFDMVLQLFPLLLQLALLLFSSALSIYLWTIHRSIAIIVLALTLLGFTSYVFLLVSAIISPDSPFQMPLPVAPFVARVLSRIVRVLQPSAGKRWKFMHMWSSWSRSFKSGTCTLPCFVSRTSTSNQIAMNRWDGDPDYYFDVPSPSAEVPAVLWVLETSTDPSMISVAAEMIHGLQWSLDLDLTSPMARLAQTLESCFELGPHGNARIRDGMTNRALNCGRAYGSLRLVARASGIHGHRYTEPSLFFLRDVVGEPTKTERDDPAQFSRLLNVLRILKDWPELVHDPDAPQYTQWALYVMPLLHRNHGRDVLTFFLDHFEAEESQKLDRMTFLNYLCCLNSFFGTVNSRVIAEIDKSRFQESLLLHLFKALRATTPSGLNPPLMARTVNLTARLATSVEQKHRQNLQTLANLMTEIVRFCSTYPRVHGWLDVLVSAATLARVDNIEDWGYIQDNFHKTAVQEVGWIYLALEHVQISWETNGGNNLGKWDNTTARQVESLLQVLFCVGRDAPQKPTTESLRVILQALSIPSDISCYALQVLHANQTWFTGSEIEPVTQGSSVWSHLGRIALEYPQMAHCYIELGKNLAHTPGWGPIIYEDLATWITVFSGNVWGRNSLPRAAVISVIRNVWVPDFDIQYRFADATEESWALALTALSTVWDNFRFAGLQSLTEVVRLGRCTVSTAFQVECFHYEPGGVRGWNQISPKTRAIFSKQLTKSLTLAADNARKAFDLQNPLSGVQAESKNYAPEPIAQWLETLGETFGSEFDAEVHLGGSRKECNDWGVLKNHFLAELEALDRSSHTARGG